jgi:3-oxoacyl-[acyl-carrier-protein] synthase III
VPSVGAATAPAHAATAPSRVGGAAIAGLGIAVPASVVPNEPIAARLGVSTDWIVARTGVEERRIAAPGEELVSYAARAGDRALASAALDAREVDLVLVATMSHERISPSASALVCERLGTARAGAIDVGAACSGFVSALVLAAGAIESRRAERVLVVGADLLSRLTDPDDRSTAALFGDGAGAVVLGSAEGAGAIGPAAMGADGSRSDLVTAERGEGVLRMKGHDTFKHAVDRLAQATIEAAGAAGLGLYDIDLFAYHQANSRILRAVGERLGLDPTRVVDCIRRYGNTSAATIPLALAEARDAGRLIPGSRVLLAAFGGGLTWAATVVEWGGGGEAGDDA